MVYDAGHYYPHHNLYYVVSDTWDLRTLQTVLRSSVAEFFVALYSVKMRGGYLRFQAQYLRRIRLPHWKDVSEALRDRLRAASEDERSVCDAVTFDLYKLTIDEQEMVKTAVYQAERATKGFHGIYTEMSEETGLKQLVAGFASQVAAASL